MQYDSQYKPNPDMPKKIYLPKFFEITHTTRLSLAKFIDLGRQSLTEIYTALRLTSFLKSYLLLNCEMLPLIFPNSVRSKVKITSMVPEST